MKSERVNSEQLLASNFGKGDADLRELSLAMSNPRISNLVRRAVVVKRAVHSQSFRDARAPRDSFTREDTFLSALSVEDLFDRETIRHAAAVTLQALARRVQTQEKIRRGLIPAAPR